MRVLLLFFCFLFISSLDAQPPQQRDFMKFQRSFKKVSGAFENKEELLKAAFKEKGLVWPAKYLYLRSFKYDSELEVWVKNTHNEPYKLFKTYKICALAGSLGPKRFEGDFQVPEGLYYLNQFKPNSNYHMALGVNYPNASDRILSDPVKPGSEIYVHGSCVTVGCIPLTDQPMEELYVLAASTKTAGQDFIPIHVFPVKFKKLKSLEYLEKYLVTRPDYQPMVNSLMKVYFYFDKNKRLPTMLINTDGSYDIAESFTYTLPKKKPEVVFKENVAPRKKATKTADLTDKDFYPAVYKMPVFPGGTSAFQEFLDQLSIELSEYLLPAKKRIFVQVNFVIDKAGNLVNVKVSDNASNEINNHILARFEALPKWEPAIRQEPVAIRLQQSIMIDAKPVIPQKPDEDVEE